MENSSSRIVTIHVGSLVRPPEIRDMMQALTEGAALATKRLWP